MCLCVLTSDFYEGKIMRMQDEELKYKHSLIFDLQGTWGHR